MNSSTIAAVAPGLKPQAERVSSADTPDTDASHSFANVLAGQNAETPDEPTHGGLATPANGGATAPGSDDAQVNARRKPGQDEDTQDAIHGTDLTLPAIALEIALHARDQAVARANPASSESAAAARRPESLVEMGVASARAVSDAKVASALPNAIASARILARQDNAVATASANERTNAATSLLGNNTAQTIAGAADLNTGLSAKAQATLRRAAPTAAESSAFAAAAATGRQAATDGRNISLSRNAADITFMSNPVAPTSDTRTFEASSLFQTLAERSAAAAGAPVNPFVVAGTPTLASGPAIATPMHQPGWNTDFSRQVVMLAHNAHSGAQTAELRLDPPELGPLRISISLNDGMASALFVSAHASVRQAIESALPQLSQQLAQAGISLGDTHVGDHGQTGFSFSEESGQRQGRASAAGLSTGTTESADALAVPRSGVSGNNLVDTFA